MRIYSFGLVFVLALSACGPPPREDNHYRRNGLYSQNFVSPVAVLVQERNGEPFYFASSFLQSKESGIFVTAKHFVENIGGSNFKVFFNGKVYDGLVVATPSISDLALTGIKGANFNPAYFPDPLSLSESQLKIGDRVRILGMHPHPVERQAHKVLVGIFKGYYDMFWQKREFVFDELEAKVSNLSVEVKNDDIAGTPEGAGFISNTYIEIITVEDHHFSFGGLSGGVVVNEKNEVVGVVSHAREGGYVLDGLVLDYQPWDTVRLVPVKELHELMAKLLVEKK